MFSFLITYFVKIDLLQIILIIQETIHNLKSTYISILYTPSHKGFIGNTEIDNLDKQLITEEIVDSFKSKRTHKEDSIGK